MDPKRLLDESYPDGGEQLNSHLTAGRSDTRGRGVLMDVFNEWVKAGSPDHFKSTLWVDFKEGRRKEEEAKAQEPITNGSS